MHYHYTIEGRRTCRAVSRAGLKGLLVWDDSKIGKDVTPYTEGSDMDAPLVWCSKCGLWLGSFFYKMHVHHHCDDTGYRLSRNL